MRPLLEVQLQTETWATVSAGGGGQSKRRSPDLACFSFVPLGARTDSHMAGYGHKDLVREVKNAGKRGHS